MEVLPLRSGWAQKMADMATVGTRQQGEVDEAQHPSGRGV